MEEETWITHYDVSTNVIKKYGNQPTSTFFTSTKH